MKFSKYWIDIAAIAILFLIMTLFFGQLLTGNQIIQPDIIQYKGMSSEIQAISDSTDGKRIIHWTNSMFGGMPTYFLTDAIFQHNNIAHFINHGIRSVLPGPSGILFIALVCFYILCRTVKINQWLSIIGAFGFASGSFVIISLIAGHNSKINAYAYAPLILAGVISIFRERPWRGVFYLGLGLAAQLAANHLQITFYTFLICLAFTGSEIISFVRANQFKTILKPILFSAFGVLLAIGINYNKLITIYKHTTYTVRGGNSPFANPEARKSTGLDYDRATMWSYKPLETMTTIIPNFMGGASYEELGEQSKWKNETQLPNELRERLPTYWGNMPFTSGPVYIGILFFSLFVLGLFILPHKMKWWALAATLILMLLSWGKYSPLYNLFFYGFPLFSKFRTPMMALLMFSFLIPFIGTLALDHTLKSQKLNSKHLIYALCISGGFLLLFGLLGNYFYSFSGSVDNQLISGGFPKRLISLLKQNRSLLLRNDSLRSIALLSGLSIGIYFFLKKKISASILITAFAVLSFMDLFFVNKRYLTNENFESIEEYEYRFAKTPIDKAILNDKSYFRVVNLATGNPFQDAKTSNHLFSIGGYHAAKLQCYDDLIQQQLSKNFDVMNMLNTKYIITQTKDGQIGFQKNEEAYGNAWFVDSLKFVTSPKAEMDALDKLNLSKNAVLEQDETNKPIQNKTYSSNNASISLTKYDPEKLSYKAVNNSNQTQFAVFSEVFYQQKDGDGWHAFIDEQEVPIYRVNYLLRGLEIPNGSHTIEFRYITKAFNSREMITKLFSGLLLLCGVWFFATSVMKTPALK